MDIEDNNLILKRDEEGQNDSIKRAECPAVIPRSLKVIEIDKKHDDNSNMVLLITVLKTHEYE